MGHMLYTVDLDQGQASLKSYHTGTSLGVTADIEGVSTTIVAGSKEGFARFDLVSGQKEILAKFWPDDDKDKVQRYVSLMGTPSFVSKADKWLTKPHQIPLQRRRV